MHLAVGLSHRLESTTVHSAGVIAPTGVRGAGSRAISRLSWCGRMARGGLPFGPPPSRWCPNPPSSKGGFSRYRVLPVRR